MRRVWLVAALLVVAVVAEQHTWRDLLKPTLRTFHALLFAPYHHGMPAASSAVVPQPNIIRNLAHAAVVDFFTRRVLAARLDKFAVAAGCPAAVVAEARAAAAALATSTVPGGHGAPFHNVSGVLGSTQELRDASAAVVGASSHEELHHRVPTEAANIAAHLQKQTTCADFASALAPRLCMYGPELSAAIADFLRIAPSAAWAFDGDDDDTTLPRVSEMDGRAALEALRQIADEWGVGQCERAHRMLEGASLNVLLTMDSAGLERVAWSRGAQRAAAPTPASDEL